jgi:hypothetical protein
MLASPALLMALVAASLSATAAQAQKARIAGASIERFGGLAGLTAVNFRRTDISAGRVGPDFAIGFVPEFLRARTLLLDIDAGFAYAAPVGPGLLLLKGGPATLFGVGGASDIYFGLQGGMAATVPIEKGCHLRVDLSRRVYFEPGENSFALWSFGVGLAVGPPR